MAWASVDLAPVGPDQFVGWTRWGSYVVGPSHTHGGFVAAFTDRKSRRQELIGRFPNVRDAKIAAQTHASVHRKAA